MSQEALGLHYWMPVANSGILVCAQRSNDAISVYK